MQLQRTYTLIGMAAFFTALNCQARLGYTLDECIAHYGPVVSDQAGKEIWPVLSEANSDKIHVREFNSDGIAITALFVEGKVVRITYKKESDPFFSSADVQSILRKNGDSKRPWTKEPELEKSKDPFAIELARRLTESLPEGEREKAQEMKIEEWYNAKKGHEDDADLRYEATTWANDAGLYQIEVKDNNGMALFMRLQKADLDKRNQKTESEKQQSIDKL